MTLAFDLPNSLPRHRAGTTTSFDFDDLQTPRRWGFTPEQAEIV